jgi:hypothetical protein
MRGGDLRDCLGRRFVVEKDIAAAIHLHIDESGREPGAIGEFMQSHPGRHVAARHKGRDAVAFDDHRAIRVHHRAVEDLRCADRVSLFPHRVRVTFLRWRGCPRSPQFFPNGPRRMELLYRDLIGLRLVGRKRRLPRPSRAGQNAHARRRSSASGRAMAARHRPARTSGWGSADTSASDPAIPRRLGWRGWRRSASFFASRDGERVNASDPVRLEALGKG